MVERGGGSLALTGIGELTTNDVDDASGKTDAVVIVGGTIAFVGPESAIPVPFAHVERRDVSGRAVLPGFVDAHTHAVFAGDRAHEFHQRLAGETYEGILASGGGIHSTVAATRSATARALCAESGARLLRMLAAGTTTAEVKTGYGLDVDTEVKMAQAISDLDASLPIDLVGSFLGAHVVPSEFEPDRDRYVDLVVGDMLEAVAPNVSCVDVFCDPAAFTLDEARRIAKAASDAGLAFRIHADQTGWIGATALAAEVGAVSADHLDHASDSDLAALAVSGTVGVLVPGVSYSLGLPYPDGRRMIDAGVTVAIATDCNPGTSYVEHMSFVIALAVASCGLTIDEAVRAATLGGAKALALEDRGRLAPGMLGDLVVLDAPSKAHLGYRPDRSLVHTVVKRGVVVASAATGEQAAPWAR